MPTFGEITQNLKINKLVKEKYMTSKEAKEALNKASVLTSSYAITILKELSKSRPITKEDVDRVYKTLKIE